MHQIPDSVLIVGSVVVTIACFTFVIKKLLLMTRYRCPFCHSRLAVIHVAGTMYECRNCGTSFRRCV